MNKEQIYDAQIAPLMANMLALCQQHGIAMVASFAIGTPEDPELVCTSLLPDGKGEAFPTFQKAAHLIRFGHTPSVVAFTITKAAPAESAEPTPQHA